MPNRKIYCQVVEGVVYDDRCLFKLSKIIEGNKTCEACVLRELERVKCPGIKGVKALAKEKTKTGPTKRPQKIRTIANDTEQTYSMKSMMELLGRSRRRIQGLAKEGKIPACKVGSCWVFGKKEIDAWVSKNTTLSPQCHDDVDALTTSTQCGDTDGVNDMPPMGECASPPGQDSQKSTGSGEP